MLAFSGDYDLLSRPLLLSLAFVDTLVPASDTPAFCQMILRPVPPFMFLALPEHGQDKHG